jgi:hypothetical protein
MVGEGVGVGIALFEVSLFGVSLGFTRGSSAVEISGGGEMKFSGGRVVNESLGGARTVGGAGSVMSG